jgi:hypothetical protein
MASFSKYRGKVTKLKTRGKIAIAIPEKGIITIAPIIKTSAL